MLLFCVFLIIKPCFSFSAMSLWSFLSLWCPQNLQVSEVLNASWDISLKPKTQCWFINLCHVTVLPFYPSPACHCCILSRSVSILQSLWKDMHLPVASMFVTCCLNFFLCVCVLYEPQRIGLKASLVQVRSPIICYILRCLLLQGATMHVLPLKWIPNFNTTVLDSSWFKFMMIISKNNLRTVSFVRRAFAQ